jgi:hypothetical protein
MMQGGFEMAMAITTHPKQKLKKSDLDLQHENFGLFAET